MATNWAGMSDAYDASFGRLCAGTIPFLIDRARSVPAHIRAADVGCGTGLLTTLLADAGHHAIGVDSDSGMIEFARSRHPGCEFVVGALPSLPFADD